MDGFFSDNPKVQKSKAVQEIYHMYGIAYLQFEFHIQHPNRSVRRI